MAEPKLPPTIEIDEAAQMWTKFYGELAGEEALFRAFLAECELNRAQARFWVRVYEKVSEK